MDQAELSTKLVNILQDYDFEEIMKSLVLCQIYFITENISQDKQLEYTNILANLLVSSYQEYNEENTNGTSQAKH